MLSLYYFAHAWFILQPNQYNVVNCIWNKNYQYKTLVPSLLSVFSLDKIIFFLCERLFQLFPSKQKYWNLLFVHVWKNKTILLYKNGKSHESALFGRVFCVPFRKNDMLNKDMIDTCNYSPYNHQMAWLLGQYLAPIYTQNYIRRYLWHPLWHQQTSHLPSSIQ